MKRKYGKVQRVAQQAIDKKCYDAYKNCVEKDKLTEPDEQCG